MCFYRDLLALGDRIAISCNLLCCWVSSSTYWDVKCRELYLHGLVSEGFAPHPFREY